MEHTFSEWVVARKKVDEAEHAITACQLARRPIPFELIAAATEASERADRLFVRACATEALESGQPWLRVWALPDAAQHPVMTRVAERPEVLRLVEANGLSQA